MEVQLLGGGLLTGDFFYVNISSSKTYDAEMTQEGDSGAVGSLGVSFKRSGSADIFLSTAISPLTDLIIHNPTILSMLQKHSILCWTRFSVGSVFSPLLKIFPNFVNVIPILPALGQLWIHGQGRYGHLSQSFSGDAKINLSSNSGADACVRREKIYVRGDVSCSSI